MQRIDIIDSIGRQFHTSNIENGEYSYPKAFKEKGMEFDGIEKKNESGVWKFLDIRFEANGISVLVETKNNADKWPDAEAQIAAYVEYEKRGYYMDLSDKENYQYKGSKRPKADSYINNVVETYMIDLGDGNFSAGVNFNIGSTQWNAGNKGIQILSQRYGFDKLHRDNNTYNSEINKDTTNGIIKALLTNVYKYSNSDWIKHDEIKFNSGNNNDTYEVKDELSKLAQSAN